MEPYYNIQLSEQQREILLMLGAGRFWWKNKAESDAWESLIKQVESAESHPNIEDVYEHEAKHSGFIRGEKVLVEATVEEACMSKRLSSQHLPVLINDHCKGAVAVTPHVNTVYHMEENA